MVDHSQQNDQKAYVNCTKAIQIEEAKKTKSITLGAAYELRGIFKFEHY
jgi:hypothetical protein